MSEILEFGRRILGAQPFSGVVAYMADNALIYAGGLVLGRNVVTLEVKVHSTRPAVGELLVARACMVW